MTTRARHEAGVARLRALFGVDRPQLAVLRIVGHGQGGTLRPFRRKPGVPPMRPDAAARKRRRLRKIAHESRRRNR